jgi:hypothetical protein
MIDYSITVTKETLVAAIENALYHMRCNGSCRVSIRTVDGYKLLMFRQRVYRPFANDTNWRDADVFDQFEVEIYPALKDILIAEQNKLTEEDYVALSIILDASIMELTDEFADIRTVYDFFNNVKNGLGGGYSDNLIRLMSIQHKLDNRKS